MLIIRVRHFEMLNYFQEKHFQLIKNERLSRSNFSPESVDLIVRKIEEVFGRLEVRLVIGTSRYQDNEEFVTQTIHSGEHFNITVKY